MKNDSFQSRAKRAMKDGDLTIADLERWFGRAHTTVWRWVHSGWEPGAGHQSKKLKAAGEKAYEDLALLETAIELKLFPADALPSGSSLRPQYVRNSYHAAQRARVPQAHSAK